MKINGIDIQAALKNAKRLIDEEKSLSPALRSALEVLLLVVTVLMQRQGVTSRNSSKPPSQDPNRKRNNRDKRNRKPGGQSGHVGKTLRKVGDPDKVQFIRIDRRKLPAGQYREVGFESRQVFDIDISRVVTEYRAQILEDEAGNQFVASFPEGVSKAVQYGSSVKAHAVYLSQFQLLPYARIQDYFADQLQMPLSEGSLFNFNKEAYEQLEGFETISKRQLMGADVAHSDETGINVGGKRHWLHSCSNAQWTHYFIHPKRGKVAMDDAGILPWFEGILVHDHWKPYYRYDCDHALCNAHHLRELTWAHEQDGQQWAKVMADFLVEALDVVEQAGGSLSGRPLNVVQRRYREILQEAEAECPPPTPPPKKKKGRLKRSKSRNLLERLRDFEDDVLRFALHPAVPFTNNRGENDIRMTKVQQKISGCFRSLDGARMFCRIRGYLSTCRKQDTSATEALRLLFEGTLPAFAEGLVEDAE